MTTYTEAVIPDRVPTVDLPKLQRLEKPPWQRIDQIGSWPFFSFHVAALVGAFVFVPTAQDLLLCAGAYLFRIIGISLTYHRYFAHRTFKTSRLVQFLMAFWGQTSVQKGALWWAGHHRNHHRFSDEEDDVHSPVLRGFLWAHVGWILNPRYEKTPFEVIKDMAVYPELVWLDRHKHVPSVAFAVLMFLIGGWSGLVWGFLVSTVILWHCTFSINSMAHLFGKRRYPTTDTSRNNVWLAILTGGEGWHNNHHYFCSSARLGFRWWEFDPTYYLVCLLEKLGLVWDVKRPPRHLIDASA